MVKVSVVVIAYNLADKIAACLGSILHQDFSDYEVIVVDDGSVNGTAEKVNSYPVRLVKQRNQGRGAARNAGARVSRGEMIVFLDGDCIVGRDFVRKMVLPLQNPKIGMTQGYIDIANPENLIARLSFMRARHMFKDLQYLDFAWGAAMGMKRNLFERMGGFNDSIKFGEEDDLAYRLLDAAYMIYLVKEARFFNHFTESLWKHLSRHAKTARWMVRLLRVTRRYTTQHFPLVKYFQLLVHALAILSLPLLLLEEIPLLIAEELPFLVSLSASVISHLRLACWAIKKDVRYVLIIPFEFLTVISWLVGSAMGLGDVVLRSNLRKANS
ncbi:MAG: glycosyltransferase family 2 protein [Candidatus Aminicenantes bacterium]|nr:MAG: glycosyltransferase family 2 protein [Candidatus Aminicenantes bacterium]